MSTISTITKIQASITGYGGKAVTLLSAYDGQTGVLAVTKCVDFRHERVPGCVVLSNADGADFDSKFSNDLFQQSILAYYDLARGVASDAISKRLVIDSSVQFCDPQNCISQDGFDSSGPKYRVAEITCAQVAVLATCLQAVSQGVIDASLAMYGELEKLMSGQILSF